MTKQTDALSWKISEIIKEHGGWDYDKDCFDIRDEGKDELITLITASNLERVEDVLDNKLPELAEARDNARIGRQGYMEGKITGVFISKKTIKQEFAEVNDE